MRIPGLGFLARRGSSAHHRRSLLREGALEDWKRDRGGYEGSRVGGKSDDADMSDSQLRTGRKLSRKLYKENGVYGAVVDRFADHAIGDGVVIQVENQDAQDWLDDQLGKPETRFYETLSQRVVRFIVDGEMPILISSFARPGRIREADGGDSPSDADPSGTTNTGDFFIGRLDVEGVSGVGVSPYNHDAVVSVSYRSAGGGADHDLPVAKPGTPMIPFDDNFNPLVADTKDAKPTRLCALQFWQARTIGKRSGPLFSRIIDRAGALDTIFEEFARKVEYLNRWWIHVKHKTVGDENLGEASRDKQFAEKMVEFFTSMTSGEVNVTGEDVTVDAVVPDLKMPQLKEFYEVILDMILGAYAIPRFWFSSGGDTNRSTSAEQGSPLYRFIKSWQGSVLKVCIEDLVRFLLDLGKRAGVKGLALGADTPFTVTMADVATRDSLRDADEMLRMVVALKEYSAAGAITGAEMIKILRSVLRSKWFGDLLDDEDPVPEDSDAEDIDDPAFSGSEPPEETDQDSTPMGQAISATPNPPQRVPA